MRKRFFVPMIILSILLFTSCGREEVDLAATLRSQYQMMSGCSMKAVVTCNQDGVPWQAELKCEYVPNGESNIEVLAPETIAGVTIVLDEETWYLRYGDKNLNAGMVSLEEISPAHCLPRFMNALRDGWLLEENEETWNDVSCLCITVDQSGMQNEKILSTVWLRLEDGKPLRGEIAVDGAVVLKAEFTDFTFY